MNREASLPGEAGTEYRREAHGDVGIWPTLGQWPLGTLTDAFGLESPHVVGPDIGTGASLFAAALHPGRLRSLVVGSGGSAFPLQLGGALHEWVIAPDLEPYRRIDGQHPLPDIQTPVQIIAGARDTAVPPVNAEFLHERLPKSKLDIIDAGHFTWEDSADEYAALVTSWWGGGYATAGVPA